VPTTAKVVALLQVAFDQA
jgi:hypothetical protein